MRGIGAVIVFRTREKEYRGSTALEIVQQMRAESDEYTDRERPVRHFLQWSLGRMGDRIPPRDLDQNGRMDDEALSLNFLYLCDEYGVGEVSAGSARASPYLRSAAIARSRSQ